MITPLHHSDYTLKNRAFNCRMRNRYYEEVYYAFRALLPSDTSDNKSSGGSNSIWYQNLSQEAAIFYGKADYATLYSKDKRWGILQEEIFLVHFLQELLSTIRYIIARLDTDKMLQDWSNTIQDMKSKPVRYGFVNTIQEKLDAMSSATIDEFKDLLKHVLDRFQIGNTLFGTIQELQNFY